MGARGTGTAFTLIELLIVVSIISILASIAVPNFIEAQTRAKVSRVKADMRSINTALESYRIDQPAYPPYFLSPAIRLQPTSRRLQPLTTPVAYMTSLPLDIFAKATKDPNYDTFDYVDEESGWIHFDPPVDYQWTYGYAWIMNSMGPDLVNQFRSIGWPDMFYDPTNGTVSTGDIVRVGPRGQYFQEYFVPIEN